MSDSRCLVSVILVSTTPPPSVPKCYIAFRHWGRRFWQTVHLQNQNICFLNQPRTASSSKPRLFCLWSFPSGLLLTRLANELGDYQTRHHSLCCEVNAFLPLLLLLLPGSVGRGGDPKVTKLSLASHFLPQSQEISGFSSASGFGSYKCQTP